MGVLFLLLMLFSGPGWRAGAQPFNDSFANRTLISGTNVTVSGSLLGATSEAGEPVIAGVSSGQTAWWTWTAPSNGIVTLSANGTRFNPLVAVYTGNDLATLSLVASNNYLICYEHTNCGCHWRVRGQITFHVSGGQAYQIAADSPVITDTLWIYQTVTNADAIPDGAVFNPWSIYPIGYAGPWSYYLPVTTTDLLPGGNLSLGVHLTPAPTNDDFEHSTPLHGSRLHISASNAGATKQAGEPDHLGNPGGSSVWYSWTAPVSGRVSLSTGEIPIYSPPGWYGSSETEIVIVIPSWQPDCGTALEANPLPTFFPVFAAYTGTAVDSLTPANCLPMSLDAYPNAVEFDAAKGQTYQIAFDGNMGTTGETPLYLALTKPARNDSFGHRIRLHGVTVFATGYNAGATHNEGEPAAGTNSIGKTAWWSWTAPVSGTVSVDLSGSDYAFPVAIFTGTTLSGLQRVASDAGGVSFEAVAGTTYQIAVGDAGGLTGAIKMKIQAPIVELSLRWASGFSSRIAVLKYQAERGQVVLLLNSTDGSHWKNVRTGVAHGNWVEFLVQPAPRATGPYYKAVVVDRVGAFR